MLNQEVHKATRLQYHLSVLCLTPNGPHGRANLAFLNRLANLSVRQLRQTDLACTLRPPCVAILLVGAETSDLPGIHKRIEVNVAVPSHVTLGAGGACYPQAATSGSELLQQAIDLMVRAKADGGDRLYLSS